MCRDIRGICDGDTCRYQYILCYSTCFMRFSTDLILIAGCTLPGRIGGSVVTCGVPRADGADGFEATDGPEAGGPEASGTSEACCDTGTGCPGGADDPEPFCVAELCGAPNPPGGPTGAGGTISGGRMPLLRVGGPALTVVVPLELACPIAACHL